MVESDGIGKSTSGEPGAGEAAQALRAILQTHYLRYMIIGTWALGPGPAGDGRLHQCRPLVRRHRRRRHPSGSRREADQ